MKLSKLTFRILLPAVYFVIGLLPIIGIIITIAEGPNPFGFLLAASDPGLWLLDLIDRHLVRLPALPGLLDMLIVMLVNAGIYFLVGWALDVLVNRYLKRRPSFPFSSYS
jgi:hypothetical protein